MKHVIGENDPILGDDGYGEYMFANTEVGDVFQIIACSSHDYFDGYLVVATEIKSWGIQAEIRYPLSLESRVDHVCMLVKLHWDEITFIGETHTGIDRQGQPQLPVCYNGKTAKEWYELCCQRNAHITKINTRLVDVRDKLRRSMTE